uniref:C-type lectin domain-containing protein n=1 Tax=Neogobius melanostomus TaxID=47308 RepID=A0A8C6URS8_9GOBI
MAANGPLIVFLCLTGALLTAGDDPLHNGCTMGWSRFGTRCFKFFNSEKTWTMAEESCNNLGGNLASIHSDEENAFINGLINGPAWLGGNDMDQEGVWRWTDGSPWDYTKWWGRSRTTLAGTSTASRSTITAPQPRSGMITCRPGRWATFVPKSLTGFRSKPVFCVWNDPDCLFEH